MRKILYLITTRKYLSRFKLDEIKKLTIHEKIAHITITEDILNLEVSLSDVEE